jgi:hypothetical protein
MSKIFSHQTIKRAVSAMPLEGIADLRDAS